MNLALLRRAALAPSALVVLLAAAACTPSTAPAATPAPTSDAHGLAEVGAAEVAAPALALVIGDDAGALTLLDLETEERTALAPARPGVSGVFADGRLVFRAHGSGDAATVEVFDGGRWTMPHGDHTHSFRGEPQAYGTLEGVGPVRVASTGQRTAVAFGDGEVRLLAHEELDGGEPEPLTVGHAGPVVPLAEHLLVPTGDEVVRVVDARGEPTDAAPVPCGAVADADVTRVGAVFACAEGAVLFTRQVGGAVAGEAVPYPGGAPAAAQLDGRTDRPDLAGVAGDRGAWLLDVRARAWTLIPSEVPLVRAVALGDDDSRTVALDADGRVRVLAPDGTVLARSEPLLADALADPELRDRVDLRVTATRAYVSDPVAGSVIELGHDDARVTRTFPDLQPRFLHLVG